MAQQSFKRPTPRSELPISLLLGGVFALALFVVMALVQTIGGTKPPSHELTEEVVAYAPPEIEAIEEEPPPPIKREEEPSPELEDAPPMLSLEQLDLALNPGTGGSIVADFSLPTINASARALGTADFVDFSDLDQTPKPLPGSKLKFPRRLKRKALDGRVVLLIKLDKSGGVIEAEVESSNLPDFSEIVVRQIEKWQFTPPTRDGNPVRAKARFPIPIRIGG